MHLSGELGLLVGVLIGVGMLLLAPQKPLQAVQAMLSCHLCPPASYQFLSARGWMLLMWL